MQAHTESKPQNSIYLYPCVIFCFFQLALRSKVVVQCDNIHIFHSGSPLKQQEQTPEDSENQMTVSHILPFQSAISVLCSGRCCILLPEQQEKAVDLQHNSDDGPANQHHKHTSEEETGGLHLVLLEEEAEGPLQPNDKGKSSDK